MSQNTELLLLYPTSHGALMFSRSEKYIEEQIRHWQCTDRQDRAGYFWYETSVSFQILKFGNKFQQYIPFCGSLTVCWSASVQVAREPNISSTLLVIAQNEHQKMSCFNRGNTSVHRFSSSSPPMWIYSPVWFVCQTKMALWLARLPVNQASVKRANWACYNG